MGKIDKAINIARGQREGTLADVQGRDRRVQGKQILTKASPPAIFQLQEYAKHKPPWQHLDRHRIIHDRFPEKGLTHYKMLRTRVLHQLQSRLDLAGKLIAEIQKPAAVEWQPVVN